MQIEKCLKHQLPLRFWLTAVLLCCAMGATTQGRGQGANKGPQSPPDQAPKSAAMNYQILDGRCSKEGYCGSIVYLDAKHFNETDLRALAKILRPKYLGRASASFYLFDDLELAKIFLKKGGGIEALARNVRGHYYRNYNKEYINYYPDRKDPTILTKINLKARQRRRRS